nr:MAG TPA: hypothetical protein [Caudoviricetes sp.]
MSTIVLYTQRSKTPLTATLKKQQSGRRETGAKDRQARKPPPLSTVNEFLTEPFQRDGLIKHSIQGESNGRHHQLQQRHELPPPGHSQRICW